MKQETRLMSGKTALLAGGSGLVGGHCLNRLLDDDHYSRVEILVRRPLAMDHPKLVQHRIDFDHLEEQWGNLQADDVFCCLGTTIKQAGSQAAFYQVDYTYPVELARLSHANGANQFLLVSALGANSDSSIFYNRVKGSVEQAISQIGFAGVHIFRPSLLLGERAEKRRLEDLGQTVFKWFSFGFRGPLRKYKPITGKTVAYAMVNVANQPTSGTHIFESGHIQSMVDET